jgi:hypothetical protein
VDSLQLIGVQELDRLVGVDHLPPGKLREPAGLPLALRAPLASAAHLDLVPSS